MHVLEMNVVTEVRKPKSPKVDTNVLPWANGVPVSSLHWK